MSRGRFVSDDYGTIFADDPLLLKESQQRKYGRAMLKHLLVYRPLTTSRSVTVDLQNPARKPVPPLPAAPTFRQVKRYQRARAARIDLSKTDLTEKEIEELWCMTMVSDGSTEARANNDYKNHSDVWKGLLPQRKNGFDHRLRIAAVGFRVAISKLRDRAYLGEQLCFMDPPDDEIPPEGALETELGRTQAVSGTLLDKWHERICTLIKKSRDRGAQIIVLPEFALTPMAEALAVEDDLQAICSHSFADNFLLAGTRHEGRYNRALVLSMRHGSPSKKAHWHYKSASAKGLGENVLGPQGKGAFNYQSSIMIGSDEALLAIGICYDAYDPTTFLNLFLDAVRNYKGSIPRIILIPSFNPSPDFVALLRDLSFLARCAVVYVNALHGDATMFMCGFDIEDFDGRMPDVFSKIADRLIVLQSEIGNIKTRATSGAGRPTDARQRNLKEDQSRALKILQRRLTSLRARGDLEHLITIEDCSVCKQRGAHGHDACFRDIQYYNLPPGLLAALFDFRRDYFGLEDFLPEPLRWARLDDAAKAIDRP